MQDKYVGDVGDFGKYGLLRSLCMDSTSSAHLKLGVLWYLAHWDIDSKAQENDGKHISYLGKPGYEECDRTLFKAIGPIARHPALFHTADDKGTSRRYIGSLGDGVRAIEKVLPAGTRFFCDQISSSGVAERSCWLERAIRKIQECDIVFLDPDNGIFLGGNGTPAKAGKYVMLGEIDALWEKGFSLVIYHHLGRKGSHDNQIKHVSGALSRATGGASIWGLRYRRGSSRAFFVVAQNKHRKAIQTSITLLENGYWRTNNHFEITSKPSR